MPRINPVTPQQAQPELKEIYQKIESKFGKVPNIFLNLGNSINVLKGFLTMSEAADKTSLSPKVREQIALTIGQANHCNYCLSAHTLGSKGLGLNEESIIQARRGESSDPKTHAILKFAKIIVEKNGHVSKQETEELKAAGVSDAELTEIVYVVMLNMFTNYFNHVTDPMIDFPIAPELALKK